MGTSCGVRNLMYAVAFLQFISTAERQIFDFLGYMWIPILANFLNFIFVIFGIFGVYQYRFNYLISYICWNLVWLGWNIFIVCLYLEIGQLNLEDDLLSFGTGSYSWWLINGFGCKPEYFPANSTLEVDDSKHFMPFKPTKVTGCLIQYQYVELTHACIQILFGVLGLSLAAYIAHHLVTVIIPRRKKSVSNGNAMYSIEYSSTVNETIIGRDELARCQETDFYSETRMNGASAAAQMTPRRVKRRSYNRTSTRSAGKVQSKQHRASTRSTRSLGRATGSRAMNPVTRLMEFDDRARNPIIDSSTSNDGTERYGHASAMSQPPSIGVVNQAFESSRPNSLYSAIPGASSVMSNQQSSITDCETVSRPPSALTSYSNFHGQRRPGLNSGPHSILNRGDNFTNLTQESLIHQGGAQGATALASNFKGTHLTQESLTNHVDTSRLAQNHYNQAQQPLAVPNGGFNQNASYDDLPPPPPPLSSSPTDELHNRGGQESDSAQDSSISMPVPLQRSNPRRNEYVNMPVSQSGNHQPNHLEDLEPPPLPGRPHNYANMGGFSYHPDPPSDLQTSRNFNLASKSSRYNDNSSADESLSLTNSNVNYNDMMTLKLDAKLNYHPEPSTLNQVQNQRNAHDYANGIRDTSTNQHREISIDYDFSRSTPSTNGISEHVAQRVPTGHQRRDRASLRAKHKQDMQEQQQRKAQQSHSVQNSSRSREEDEYGFTRSKNSGMVLPNGSHQSHSQQNHQPQEDDKWYLHDTMKPIGAPQHGGNCKCYRCQRKLTAI